MALIQSPGIVTSGLVFAYDMANGKSNIGAPTTNSLASPSVNGYPTSGNSWGTYNTNQYGSGTYFSIGTVSSVSSNIVTMSSAHSLRTYDVMQPQTTGGGVTAGTNYLVKKLSDTTFCLYPYNSSQDGSQGYINPATGNHKVYDDFEADNKIAINSSSFPTMWWGYPHLPNSGLVKELISKGFNGIPGRASTDCMRLHYIRTDGVKDGMAYGADGTVTAGSPHTISFWTKSVDAAAVGQSVSYQIYNYGVVTPAGFSFSYTLGPVGVWQKQSLTFTPTNPYCISYWFGQGSGPYKWDLSNIQFEAGSIASNFTAGTRSNTQALIDLTNNNTITATSLTYASDGTFSYTKANGDYLTLPLLSTSNANVTFSCWAYITLGTNGALFESGRGSGFAIGIGNNYLTEPGNNIVGLFPAVRWISTGVSYGTTGWKNVVVSMDNSSIPTIYVNGVLIGTYSGTVPLTPNTNSYVGRVVGDESSPSDRAFNGRIDIVNFYNRALSAAEVKQNFQALRGRFGI